MKQLFLAFLVFSFAGNSFAQKNDSTIAMIKKNLATSKSNLKKYEWIETTTTYLKGEAKSTKQNRCYYDATGKLTKVPAGGGSPAPEKKGGIRGKVVENKKDEMGDYVKNCIAKIKTYLPPDPSKLQQIYASGKAMVNVIDPGKKFKIDFPNYNQPGDQLSIAADVSMKLLNGVSVNTYMDKPDDKISLDVKYSALPDGTEYQNTTTLDAPTKNLKIVIQNSGYKISTG